tara:strand:- start:83 stop:382 length:300 start_codon:yes stop_codon:yes gene_type:complete
MEKQIREFKVDYELDWDYGVSLEKLEVDIKLMKELGVNQINIESGISYDCPYVTIEPVQRRIETDDEYEKRVGEIKYRNEETKRRDLEQLARLKDKYEE